MKCRTCKIPIPGENGDRFYGEIGTDGVQCEKCAVAEYKRKNQFWNVQVLKNTHPSIVNNKTIS